MSGSIFSTEPIDIRFVDHFFAPSDLFQERLTLARIAESRQSKTQTVGRQYDTLLLNTND